LAVPLTEFDLANVTTSSVDFLSDQRRALQAAAGFAARLGTTVYRIYLGDIF